MRYSQEVLVVSHESSPTAPLSHSSALPSSHAGLEDAAAAGEMEEGGSSVGGGAGGDKSEKDYSISALIVIIQQLLIRYINNI